MKFVSYKIYIIFLLKSLILISFRTTCILNIRYFIYIIPDFRGERIVEDIRGQLKALSKRHSLEMISILLDGPKHIAKLSNELRIPYTTAQQRVAELERVGLLNVIPDVDDASKRAIKRVHHANFRVELTPRTIRKIVDKEQATDTLSG